MTSAYTLLQCIKAYRVRDYVIVISELAVWKFHKGLELWILLAGDVLVVFTMTYLDN